MTAQLGSISRLLMSTYALTGAQADTLRDALLEDAQDYYYSSCLSLVDGIRGIDCGFYTWATIKCYFSVFYAFRAILAVDKLCVFYVSHTPYSTRAQAGSHITKKKGTTHGVVLGLFKTDNSGHKLLSQDIELVDPLQWITQRREESNYGIPRFVEPKAPQHFRNAEKLGVRKLIAAYLADETDLYTFDSDHAMLAYPVAAIVTAGNELSRLGGVSFDREEMSFLASRCRDSHGPLSPLLSYFDSIVQ